jgi:cyanate permease
MSRSRAEGIVAALDVCAVGLLIAQCIASVVSYAWLPPQLAVHFAGAAPDGWMPRFLGVLIAPATCLFCIIVIRRKRARPTEISSGVVALLCGLVTASAHGVILYNALRGASPA